ncbi:MAG TPA: ribonuclease P protein component [Steroidobacteraceae bacterium]|nr:ribonuclease P protein component [Steroidobacteraceae bacterium]
MPQADRERLTFPAARRLRRKWEFDQLYAQGKRLGNSHFGMTVHPNSLGLARLGMAVASKPFGGSVPRNRIRRLIRESFRLRQHELPNVDMVISARPRAREASAAELRASLDGLWDKVRVQCASSSQP